MSSIGPKGMNQPRILITAGPTHEPIDRVRSLNNQSSGRLGISLAEAAVGREARTTLLLGPTHHAPPDHSLLVTKRFQSTSELEVLLEAAWPDHDLLLMAAAVADYRPRNPRLEEKLPRSEAGLTLELEATPDLLAGLAERSRPDQLRVGWALESKENLRSRAIRKLSRKHLHLIVANSLETIDSRSIEPLVLAATEDGPRELSIPSPRMEKADFAAWLVDEALQRQRKLSG
jgi:phosphopantothenoylcysteine decarboxylase/phosphopantothenate--cysteine ligase